MTLALFYLGSFIHPKDRISLSYEKDQVFHMLQGEMFAQQFSWC